MRLFGTPGAGLNRERSTFGFLAPFDLSILARVETANKGLVLLDFEQHFVLGDLTLEVIAYPDFVFATPPPEKVDYLTGRVVLLEVTGSEPPTIAGSCVNPAEVLDALTGVSVYPDQGSPTPPVGGLLGGSGQDPEITGSV